ncbi:TetR/AcrR family transcriptional regulator [Adlercreutzia sp. ZJ154]|uniref:TetR/AcrR family transcriptional regulator n=1 Tax=Adlercreutzia sp. ZJ154 TaxID=2709790 RepID=UPI0013ED644B|nr:TetR/AcrR family transcriptional regulator [Adlercreutzia sp. ZJ154]
MAKDTKQRILDEALVMFAQRGYEGTNMRELAQALGLGKSALYKHYASKEDIWTSMLEALEAHYSQSFGSEDNLPPIPSSCDELVEMSIQMVGFTIHDEKIVLTRRLLLAEQHRDERAKALASEHFLKRLERIFTHVFAGMMDKDLLKRCDPRLLALAYTAPVSALIMECDRYPEKEREITERIHAFITHFTEAAKEQGK